MSDFRDPELENLLGRLSGSYPDANVAYSAVTGRVRQAKRRRAFVASTAACVVIVGMGALAVRGGSAGQNLQPADQTSQSITSSPSTESHDTMTSSSVSTSESTERSESSMVSQPSDTVAGGSVAPATNSVPGSSGHSTSTSSSNSGSNSGSSNTAVAVPDQSKTYVSAGGTITVAVVNNGLSLTASTPAAGFTAQTKHDRADRVEVEFSDGNVTWRIRVDLAHGTLTDEITSS